MSQSQTVSVICEVNGQRYQPQQIEDSLLRTTFTRGIQQLSSRMPFLSTHTSIVAYLEDNRVRFRILGV